MLSRTTRSKSAQRGGAATHNRPAARGRTATRSSGRGTRDSSAAARSRDASRERSGETDPDYSPSSDAEEHTQVACYEKWKTNQLRAKRWGVVELNFDFEEELACSSGEDEEYTDPVFYGCSPKEEDIDKDVVSGVRTTVPCYGRFEFDTLGAERARAQLLAEYASKAARAPWSSCVLSDHEPRAAVPFFRGRPLPADAFVGVKDADYVVSYPDKKKTTSLAKAPAFQRFAVASPVEFDTAWFVEAKIEAGETVCDGSSDFHVEHGRVDVHLSLVREHTRETASNTHWVPRSVKYSVYTKKSGDSVDLLTSEAAACLNNMTAFAAPLAQRDVRAGVCLMASVLEHYFLADLFHTFPACDDYSWDVRATNTQHVLAAISRGGTHLELSHDSGVDDHTPGSPGSPGSSGSSGSPVDSHTEE